MSVLLPGLAVGAVVGAVVGLVGAGGAIIAVPALVYLVGLDPDDAVPTSLIVVGLSSLAGLLPRLRTGIDWKLVAILGVAGFPASWAGAAVGKLLPPDVLMLLFAAIMVVAGLRMLLSGRAEQHPSGSADRQAGTIPKALAVGLAVGFLTGLLGVGGGFLLIPALTLFLRLPMQQAVGTSLAVIAVNSASGLSAHLAGLAIDWTLTLSFAAVAVAASLAAARFSRRLDDRLVSRGFAVLVLLIAVWVAVGSLPAVVGRAASSAPPAPASHAPPTPASAAGPAASPAGASPLPAPASFSPTVTSPSLPKSPSPLPSTPPSPSTPAGPGQEPAASSLASAEGIKAELASSRLFAGERSILVRVSNTASEPASISAATLESTLYAGPQHWIPARPGPVRLRAGGTVSLPVPLSEPVCTGDSPAGTRVLLELSFGSWTVSASDPRGEFAALHLQDCLRKGLESVGRFSIAPELEVAPDGRTAVAHILVAPSGQGRDLVLHRIDPTPLLRPGAPWPAGIVITGTDPPRDLALTLAPQRCDDHALAEDKVGTRLPLIITAGDRTGQVRLEPPPGFTAAVFAFVRQACSKG